MSYRPKNRLEMIQDMKAMAARKHGGEDMVTWFQAVEDKMKEVGVDNMERTTYQIALQAHQGDQMMQRELQALRATMVNNFLRARSNVMGFFEMEDLGPDEMPIIGKTTDEEVKITYVGRDGGIRHDQNELETGAILVPHKEYTTGVFEFPLTDPVTGNISVAASIGRDMGYDLDMTISADLWRLLVFKFGATASDVLKAFTYTGAKVDRTLNLHSSIDVSNLPATNILTASTSGSNTQFTLECLQEVVRYCGAWGHNIDGGMQMKPVDIFIPSKDVFGFLDDAGISVADNELTRQIHTTGFIFSFGGVNWNLVADVTLSSKDGLAYVRTTKPIGKVWTKTSRDQHIIDTNSFDVQMNNKGKEVMKKFLAHAVIEQWRINCCAVRYKTAVA
jgi:hypothetical protein